MIALEKAGELHRVSAKVSPMLEVAEIADRVLVLYAGQVVELGKV